MPASSPRVKVCGLTNLPDAELAVGHGAWALGMIFFEGSPRRCGARVIKSAQVSGAGDIRDLERFHVDFHLLDARARSPRARALRGGTGESFDWGLVAARRSTIPLILSGGLSADNVADAIAAVHPYALDTASGTEAAPGRKDPERLSAFFAAARSARAGTTAEERGAMLSHPA